MSISRKSHKFIVECADGPLLALGGMVETFPLVAQVLRDWMFEERSAVEMNSTPRLAVSKGEAKRVFGDTVELLWWLPLQPFSWASDAHRAILEATKGIPELRQLAPILSMNDLLFSDCTELPWQVRAPWLRIIDFGAGRPATYEVRIGNRTFDPDRSTLLGTGDVDTAIALVQTHLPTDLLPAIVGDGYDLNPDVPRPPSHR